MLLSNVMSPLAKYFLSSSLGFLTKNVRQPEAGCRGSLRKLRQGDCEVKAGLCYILRQHHLKKEEKESLAEVHWLKVPTDL